jgi:hypothetical protein
MAATTGIAATLLKGATTVHKAFKVPVNFRAGLHITVDRSAPEYKTLSRAKVIIIDEASALSKELLNFINDVLKQIEGNNENFGGKILILGGDFKQTLPVIPKGTDLQTISNCIKSSLLWRFFKNIRLT